MKKFFITILIFLFILCGIITYIILSDNNHFAHDILDNNYKKEIIEIIKDYDYIIICTRYNYKMDACLAEGVADICNETKKRFMICHSTDVIFPNLEKISKRRSVRFINKMKKKKYLLNEIEEVSTSLVSTKADFVYKGKKYSVYSLANSDLTYGTKFNIKNFANVIEYDIIKMLEV